MALDQSMFIDKFCSEAMDVKSKIEAAMGSLQENPEKTDEIMVIKKSAHSLKGLSNMLKFTAVGGMMSSLEAASEVFVTSARPATVDYLYAVMEVLTALDESIAKIKAGSGNTLNWDHIVEKLKAL